MKRNLQILADTIRKNKAAVILFAVMILLNGAVFFLYDILTEAFLYSGMLIFVILLLLLAADFFRQRKKAEIREYSRNSILTAEFEPEEKASLADRDYSEIITLLQKEIRNLQVEFSERQQADDDYYTAWVHQIKTPIAVMKLELSEDTKENRALLSELFRIEQYVEMVLDYVRLRSDSSDLVIKEYELDAVIRETLRKFASQFILRRLKLCYETAQGSVITDKKWLCFILDQLVSNAIKYTPEGEITIEASGSQIRVSDTGIGIAPEDLPRIFEKGYTGVNGRLGEKSSGLGLFLTKKAAALIGADLKCESTVGKGTTFIVTLAERQDDYEHVSIVLV